MNRSLVSRLVFALSALMMWSQPSLGGGGSDETATFAAG